ncbi:MAG: hypothetical protein IKA41_07160, partial [Bacteroidaceae bacterium]|nr:hypothetical protein [Bacteroidaceae bacterium]
HCVNSATLARDIHNNICNINNFNFTYMANYFNYNRRIPTIFEIATAFENRNEGEIKPRTRVVVNTNRIGY